MQMMCGSLKFIRLNINNPLILRSLDYAQDRRAVRNCSIIWLKLRSDRGIIYECRFCASVRTGSFSFF